MGRRARTNCSPIDSAMEKYHNDIGSRLSGVFIPPQPCFDTAESSTDALNMLTLDVRSKLHNNNNNNNTIVNNASDSQTSNGHLQKSHHHDSKFERDCSPSQSPVSCQQSEKSNTLPTSLTQTPSSILSVGQKTADSYSGVEDKEKKGLMDKLTRALFQRKHTCTRCQRKSRSCLPNKNFNSTEKHYMCGRCRETNHTMKNLVSGQSFRQTKTGTIDDIIFPKPRTQLKDSGYETVTSCSTVASSNSHSTVNGPTTKAIENFSQRDNNGTPFLEDNASELKSNITHDFPVQTSCCNRTGLEQYMGVTRDDSSVRILKQVKTRYVKNYDGYLPSTQQTTQACVVKRPALPAFAAQTSEGVNPTCNDTDNTFSSADQKCVHTKKDGVTPAKICYTCRTTSKPCFRLPWKGGWLCEDCLDGVY